MPEQFRTANRSEFSRNSAWWVFNFAANRAGMHYDLISRDIRIEQERIGNEELARQAAIGREALGLITANRGDEAAVFLTEYSMNNSARVVHDRWSLSDRLVVKYSNRMVTDATNGTSVAPGYLAWWLAGAGYQYGPRVYEYERLQQSPDLPLKNTTFFTLPGTEIETLRTNERDRTRVPEKPFFVSFFVSMFGCDSTIRLTPVRPVLVQDKPVLLSFLFAKVQYEGRIPVETVSRSRPHHALPCSLYAALFCLS